LYDFFNFFFFVFFFLFFLFFMLIVIFFVLFFLFCLISKFFIFRFLASQKLFFAKRCISGVLHSGMSYFQSFYFSIFSFPEAFFRKTLHFRSSALWNVLFPKFLFFNF